jgi:hypothetical protein
MTCEHNNTGTTLLGGRRYCYDCGERMFMENEPTYYQVLANSKSLLWQKLGTAGYVVQAGTIYIGARWNAEHKVWMLGRVRWCDDCQQFEVAQDVGNINHTAHEAADITHFAPDLLGTPCDSLRPAGLRSVSG